MVRTWRSVLQRRIAHLLADFPCRTSTDRTNGADRVPPLSQGSSDKKSEKQPRPKGVSGYWDDTNVRISCSTCRTLHYSAYRSHPCLCRTLTQPIRPAQNPRLTLQPPLKSPVSTPTRYLHHFRRTHTNHQHQKEQLRDDPNAKTVIGPNTRHHDEVDQGTRPSYKEAERYSRNEPQKPSSPKPKERSKSPSRSEASKNSKCVSMRGVPLYPSATTKRYKLVL